MFPADWHIILLKPRSKEPIPRQGKHWVTQDSELIKKHLDSGGNVGVTAGPVVILDFDMSGSLVDMIQALGPLQPWVRTGSGKTHCYVAPAPGLQPKIMWQGERVGEVQRLSSQYVVCPPSIHPDTGLPYEWLVDPLSMPLPALSREWLDQLGEIPSYIKWGDTRGVPAPTEWTGPPAEEIMRRAALLPGARRRTGGIKFQCPACARDGHDKHKDNGKVFSDGRWGCAFDNTHKREIGKALGVIVELQIAPPQPSVIPVADARIESDDDIPTWDGPE